LLRQAAKWGLPVFVIGMLFYWPMAHVLQHGLTGSWIDTLLEPAVLDAIWFTVWQAALSALLCIAIGLPAAYVLYRRHSKHSRVIRALITVPFALPTIVTAIGFTVFQNNDATAAAGLDALLASPLFWIISAHVFVNFSVVVRTVGATWANLSHDTEEAAQLGGAGRFRIFWSISRPQLNGAIVSSLATVFLYCTASYGLILVLGGGMVNSIETEIAYAANQRLDLQEAGALAIVQTLLSIGAFMISSTGRRTAIGFEVQDSQAKQPKLDRRDWPAVAVTSMAALLVLAPLALIVARAFLNNDGQATLDNFADLGGRGARNLLNITIAQAALNTLRNVLVATALATLVGVAVAYLLSRRTRSKRVRLLNTVLNIAFMLPLGVSTIVLGFGYLLTFGSGWFPLRSSWLIVPLIQGLMAIPLVVRIVYPALASISEELGEQASTDGASPASAFFRIELPLVRESIGAAIGYAAIISVGEFGAASLLAYGSQATLPTVLYQLVSRPGGNNYGMAMAMSAIVIVLTFAVVFVASLPAKHRTAQRQR
jgi:thiamine transport system permease protein